MKTLIAMAPLLLCSCPSMGTRNPDGSVNYQTVHREVALFTATVTEIQTLLVDSGDEEAAEIVGHLLTALGIVEQAVIAMESGEGTALDIAAALMPVAQRIAESHIEDDSTRLRIQAIGIIVNDGIRRARAYAAEQESGTVLFGDLEEVEAELTSE